MTIRRFATLKEASEEVDHAVTWYEAQRPGLGGVFLQALDRTLSYISEFPDAGARVPHVAESILVRRVPLRQFPYYVVYRRERTRIVVVAVAHDRRAPEYWRNRPID